MVHARDVCTDPLYTEVRDAWEAEGRAGPDPLGHRVRFSLREQPAGVFFLRTTTEDAPAHRRRTSQFAEQVIRPRWRRSRRPTISRHAVLGQEQMRQLAETDPLTDGCTIGAR